MIHRTVLVKFSEFTSTEQLKEVCERFKALKNYLTGVVDIQAGLNFAEKSKDYQVVLSIRFEDKSALDAYVSNPEHQEVAAFIKEVGRVDSIGVDIEI